MGLFRRRWAIVFRKIGGVASLARARISNVNKQSLAAGIPGAPDVQKHIAVAMGSLRSLVPDAKMLASARDVGKMSAQKTINIVREHDKNPAAERFEKKWGDLRDVQTKITEIRKEIKTISMTIKVFAKPDMDLVNKYKRLSALEKEEEQLMDREKALIKETESLFKDFKSNRHRARHPFIFYTLLGAGLGVSVYVGKVTLDNSKKFDAIAIQIENHVKNGSDSGSGVGSALKATGNYLYDWGAWTANKGYDAGASVGSAVKSASSWTYNKCKFW